MFESILVAALMTTSFAIVTVGTITITTNQALAKKKSPVG